MTALLLPDIADGVTKKYANMGGPMSRTRTAQISSSGRVTLRSATSICGSPESPSAAMLSTEHTTIG